MNGHRSSSSTSSRDSPSRSGSAGATAAAAAATVSVKTAYQTAQQQDPTAPHGVDMQWLQGANVNINNKKVISG